MSEDFNKSIESIVQNKETSEFKMADFNNAFQQLTLIESIMRKSISFQNIEDIPELEHEALYAIGLLDIARSAELGFTEEKVTGLKDELFHTVNILFNIVSIDSKVLADLTKDDQNILAGTIEIDIDPTNIDLSQRTNLAAFNRIKRSFSLIQSDQQTPKIGEILQIKSKEYLVIAKTFIEEPTAQTGGLTSFSKASMWSLVTDLIAMYKKVDSIKNT